MTAPWPSFVLSTISGNAGSRHELDALVEWAGFYRPDRIVITEAYNLGGWLDKHLPGYERVQYGRKHGAEAPDVAVLARRATTRVKRRRLRKMTAPWWGPFTLRKRKARRLVVVILDKDGRTIPTLALHAASGGASGGTRTKGRNKASWRETARAARKWLKRRPVGIVTGDFNDDGRAVREHIAPTGATVRMHSNVDGDISKGFDTVTVLDLPDPPGTHGWALTTHTIN